MSSFNQSVFLMTPN